MLSKIKAFFAKLFSKKQPSVSVEEQVLENQDTTTTTQLVVDNATAGFVPPADVELPDNLKGIPANIAAAKLTFEEPAPAIVPTLRADKKSKSKKKKKS
jgi:hypothetical protein